MSKSGSSLESLIENYSERNLRKALANPQCHPDDLRNRKVIQHLDAQLRALGAKTLIIEPRYVDADYLEDYASYYVRCFQDYDRFCKRIHFFRAEISAEDFLMTIGDSGTDRFSEGYLGFIVARPLPETIVGRTVLKAPLVEGMELPCTRSYSVNLFGIPLKIEGSLAFQEQDKVLAACATVALWSAFHKAAEEFNTPQPTPGAITVAATKAISDVRALPSHELSIFQIRDAIRAVGLEPEVLPVRNGLPFLSVLYGYMKLGIPPILIFDVARNVGHAVSVVGYVKSAQTQRKPELGCLSSMVMTGASICSLIVHDDQFGPFCQLEVAVGDDRLVSGATGLTEGEGDLHPLRLIGPWGSGIEGYPAKLVPKFIVIPVYHKIRLTFADVQLWLIIVDRVMGVFFPDVEMRRAWDITLVATNQLKVSDIRGLLCSRMKMDAIRVLTAAHPRFAWRAILTVDGAPILELFADATAISQAFPFYELLWHNQEVRDLIASPNLILPLQHDWPRVLREFFAEKSKP